MIITYRIGCGCHAEFSDFHSRFLWKIIRRCRRHPNGAVPVRTMRRV